MKFYNKQMKLFTSLILLGISALGFSQTTPVQNFHDTKGNIEVTKAGQLQFTVPIDTPPGVKNISPKIDIVYTSGAGNGVVGYGGSISGISTISRIGRTIETDGVQKRVQLDYSDYYSFNGQRLILKSGEYGKDGAEYVTEKYSNIKIKSIGAITGQTWKGPEYWEITYDDGSQAWYGAIASGSSSARTPIDYNIVKLKDVNGNYVTYNYVLDGNTTVVENIQWGGNEILNKPHFNRIDFTYTVRNYAETSYIKGELLSQGKLLESVRVTSNGNQFKKYIVSYKDLQETGYKFIDKLQVFNSNNEAANPIAFTYEKSWVRDVNPSAPTWEWGDIYRLDSDTDLTGDFDGDGKLDILRYFSSTTTGIPQVGLYLLKDAFKANSEKVYLGNSIPKSIMKTSIAVNFKKGSTVYNKQGFVTYKLVNNTTTSKQDLQLSFYLINEDNNLVLDFTKVVPDVENLYWGLDVGKTSLSTVITVLGLSNIDFNGDGLSELIIQLNFRFCSPSTDPVSPTANDPSLLPENCTNYKKYVAVDLDETLQNDSWYYTLPFGDENFAKYKGGDFNGDGLSDFLKLDNTKKPYLVTFEKTPEGRYLPQSNLFPTDSNAGMTLDGLWDQSVVGDYNGDGLSDLFIPKAMDSDLWYIYLSSGIGLKENTKLVGKPNPTRVVIQSGEDVYIRNPTQFIAYDINNDGKAELVTLASGKSYSKWWQQDNPQAIRYARYKTVGIGVLASFGAGQLPYGYSNGSTIYLNSDNIAAELADNWGVYMAVALNYQSASMVKKFIFASIENQFDKPYLQWTLTHPYYDIAKEGRVVGITQGGITTNITYKELDKNINPGIYNNTKTEAYPYVEFTRASNMLVVSQMTQTVADKVLKQDFRYRGLVSHILGKGMIGFRQTARSSWYADGFENTKVWSGSEIDPVNEGVPLKEWSIRTSTESNIFPADISENNTQLLSFKSSIYQIDKILNGQVITTVSDADKAKVVTAIVPKTSKGKDFLTGATAESTLTYGQFYLPTQSVSKINGNYAVTTSTFEYDNNPSGAGANYYIGRPTSKTIVVQAYNDSQSNKEEYTYENNRLKTVKKWNSNNTGYLLDTFTYDGFGNIVQKVSSNSVDSQTESTASTYDTTGRFVITKTDNLGLATGITYNNWGQVLSQTDVLGNTITNTYDGWGKLLTSTSNLSGTTTYGYDRDNNSNVTVTQNDPDGNVSKKFTNKFGQVYKASTKAFGQGQFVSSDTQYDLLGRKIKESEPYFDGQSASQWNIITYDDTVYPAKVTATAFTGKKTETTVSGLTTTVKELTGYGRTNTKTVDALGNVVSTTDKGGTIIFSYNAAGQQTQAKYAENTVTTKYDVWGRKSEFNDPSNGVYKYEYNGFGQPKKTISPKGTKEYTYNNLGQLVSQQELSTLDAGQATNKTIAFTYNNKGMLTLKSGTIKGQPFSTEITYDPQGRLVSSVENSNGKTYSQKGIVYDDKGRVGSYVKELQSAGVITTASIENIYSGWNGELYQIKDKKTGKILWELKETNAKGQELSTKLGAVNISNTYDPNGYLAYLNESSAIKPNLLRLSYVFDALKNELRSRTTEGDFNILELFDYDDNNRLINWTNPVTGVKPTANRNVYDVKGRITSNDDVGTIKFENSAKIYQATGMTLNAAGTQNYNGDLIQTIVYNENNDPVQINGEKSRISFDYGLGNARQRVDITRLKQTSGGGGEPPVSSFADIWDPTAPVWQLKISKFYSEDGSFEVVRDQSANTEKHIIYIEGSPYESNIVYLKDFAETNGSYKFLHKDYIGSVLAISDEAGNKLEERHYDAWGNFTHLQIGSGAIITDKAAIAGANLFVDRGYTGHEHFMDVGIIHMNGRLYDPLLRRFLNADENIQDPANTQNYNKYGYVMNNPMMYNDPNGEFWWWAAGALVGGYLGGVQANGSWNPAKWDWKNTWGAVVGGAIGGASIGGALGNITNNAGAIKNILPGVVSGGLNSAFNGSSFLGGMVGGISYSANIFDNRITSSNLVNAGYKYIISPDYNEDGETEQYFQMAGFSQYGARGGIKPPFDKAEIGQLASAGIISAVTARVLMGAIGAEVAGAGVIGTGGGLTWSSIANTGTTILARTFALGLLLSVRGDSSGPQKAFVYTIMGKDDIAKFGITRAKDPDSRPSRQIPGLNRIRADRGPHSWMYLHQGVSEPEAFVYEKYYVWQYFQAHNRMPYAQRYPKEDAVTRFLYEYLKLK